MSMLETRAIVVQVQGEEALVEAKGGGGCGNCSSEGGCGSGKLTQLFCNKPRRFKVHNESHAVVGDEVQILLQDGILLRGSILMYVVPLVLLLTGGMIGSSLGGDAASRDGFAAVGAVIGLSVGFVLARWLSKHLRVSAITRPIQ